MIQTLLFFGLGFLTATFIALMVAPALRRRTERLTARRIEAAMPLTREEIQADKDRLRAEFALNARRIEMDLKASREKAAEQAVALDRGRQTLEDRDARIAEIEAEAVALRQTVAESEEKLAAFEEHLASETTQIDSRRGELERMNALYEDASLTASSRQIELVARETEIDRLASDLAALRNQRNETDRKLREAAADAKALREGMKNEARKAEEASRKIERLLADLSDREERLERRENEIARLKGKRPADAVEPAADERIAGDRDRLEQRLRTLTRENKKLKSQISGAGVAAPLADEQQELREQLHQLAAEMVNLTATLEGPQSPIRKAIEAAQATGEGAPVSLAERIRALRDAAERSRSGTLTPVDAPQSMERDG